MQWPRSSDLILARLEGLQVETHDASWEPGTAEYCVKIGKMYFPVPDYYTDANAATRAVEAWCDAEDGRWFRIERHAEEYAVDLMADQTVIWSSRQFRTLPAAVSSALIGVLNS